MGFVNSSVVHGKHLARIWKACTFSKILTSQSHIRFGICFQKSLSERLTSMSSNSGIKDLTNNLCLPLALDIQG